MDPLAGKTVSACVAELIAKPPQKAADFCDGSGPWYPRLRSVLQIAGVSRHGTERCSAREHVPYRLSNSQNGLCGGPVRPLFWSLLRQYTLIIIPRPGDP